MNVIKSMGFVDYFLIVRDFIHFARTHGVMVGPGRGSAAGSLVSYCLGITSIDPIKYGLIFERFLNPERVSMPDIDIDFAPEGRQKVIDYVVSKYGEKQENEGFLYHIRRFDLFDEHENHGTEGNQSEDDGGKKQYMTEALYFREPPHRNAFIKYRGFEKGDQGVVFVIGILIHRELGGYIRKLMRA